MIKKEIRKSLIETKEKKERLLIEERLIKNRLTILFNNVKTIDDFNKLSESKKNKLRFKIMEELSILEDNGLITEQDLGGVLQSLLGGVFGNVTQTIFEPMLNSILSGLGLDGFFKNFLISYLTSRPSEVIKSFRDCRLMTKLVSEGLVEAMVMTIQKEKGFGGFGYDLVRNSLGDAIKSNTFIQGIEKGLGDTICGLFSKYTDNAKKVAEKLKPTTPAIA
jgi:hypothetical protein